MNPGRRIREYRPGTFAKRIAYGQRDRKLMLVARGIMNGFKVVCKSESKARNLAYAFRLRASRIESDENTQFGVKIRVDGKAVYVFRRPKPATR